MSEEDGVAVYNVGQTIIHLTNSQNPLINQLGVEMVICFNRILKDKENLKEWKNVLDTIKTVSSNMIVETAIKRGFKIGINEIQAITKVDWL